MQWKVDFIQQPVINSSVVGLRRSSKAPPKVKLAPEKVTVWWSASRWIHYSFLNQSQRNNHMWETRSANRWDAPKTTMPAAAISQQNGSSSFPRQSLTIRCTAKASKAEQIRLKVLLYPLYLPDILPTGYPFFKHLNNFSQVKRFHNQQDAENAFQEFVESWSMDFYTIGINKLFLISKNVLIVMVPILINKDVFESS